MAERNPAEDRATVRAPYTGLPFRDKSFTGSQASLGAYFLRDLYQKGLLDESIIRDLIRQEELDIPVEKVMQAVRDPRGTSIPFGLSSHIEELATLIVMHN